MEDAEAVTSEEWRALYDLAEKVRLLAPWEFMEETDIFGFHHPETQEIHFVSVMGQLGTHHAVAMYPGAPSLYDFWSLAENPSAPAERVLEIPHLQSAFVDRSELDKAERARLKALGIKPRGRHAWPVFRSYQPGLVPWSTDPSERVVLRHGLSQLLEVAPRFRSSAGSMPRADRDEYLVRVGPTNTAASDWSDVVRTVPRPEPREIAFEVDASLLKAVKKLARSDVVMEVDLILGPGWIDDEKPLGRPYFPFTLLLVDGDEGLIVGIEVLSPIPSFDAMWAEVPRRILAALAKLGRRPRVILGRSPRLLSQLEAIEEEMGIEVGYADSLPALEAVEEGLLQFGRGR